jgi:hypothetical protein
MSFRCQGDVDLKAGSKDYKNVSVTPVRERSGKPMWHSESAQLLQQNLNSSPKPRQLRS